MKMTQAAGPGVDASGWGVVPIWGEPVGAAFSRELAARLTDAEVSAHFDDDHRTDPMGIYVAMPLGEDWDYPVRWRVSLEDLVRETISDHASARSASGRTVVVTDPESVVFIRAYADAFRRLAKLCDDATPEVI